MRKTFVWALMAILAVSGSAFARQGISAEATFLTGSPATTNNDDSCDISVAPAATLLLPYFDVIWQRPGRRHVWDGHQRFESAADRPRDGLDGSFVPVLDFNIFLTATMFSRSACSTFSPTATFRPGRHVERHRAGRAFGRQRRQPAAQHNDCDNLAVNIPPAFLAPIATALTTGLYAPGSCTAANRVGKSSRTAMLVDT